MNPAEYPILEFDPHPEGILEPSKIIRRNENAPEACVICFFKDAIEQVVQSGKAKPVWEIHWETGPNPVYELEVGERRVALIHPGVGAPLAAGFLEEVIAWGCRKFIAAGGCGVLDRAIQVGHLLVPTSAVRDEGTSYHYMAPGREVSPTPAALAALERAIRARGVEYLLTKTWTVDAPYRETPAKAALRRQEGCLAVEMEAAAFFAVARFRGVEFAQVLYGGDAVIEGEWDHRDWASRAEIREQLLWLAAEAALEI